MLPFNVQWRPRPLALMPKNINLVNDELPHRVGAQSDCQVTAQSACQAGEKTLRAGRDGSISRSHPPAVLKGNPKPLTEDKKKSVQFAGGDGHTKTGGQRYQPKQQAPTATYTTAATNSHQTHIPPVSLKDTQ